LNISFHVLGKQPSYFFLLSTQIMKIEDVCNEPSSFDAAYGKDIRITQFFDQTTSCANSRLFIAAS